MTEIEKLRLQHDVLDSSIYNILALLTRIAPISAQDELGRIWNSIKISYEVIDERERNPK